MPRLRNQATGVVVNVREGKVLAGYEPVEDAAVSDDAQDEQPGAAPEPEQEPTGQDEPAEEAPADYSSRTVADLRAEIERRNEGLEEPDRLPVEGKKVDLIAALEADDSK